MLVRLGNGNMQKAVRQWRIQSWSRSGLGSEPWREMVVKKCPWISLFRLWGWESIIQIYNAERMPCKCFMYSWDVFPSPELEITDYYYHSPWTEHSSSEEMEPRHRNLCLKSCWKVRSSWDFWEAVKSLWPRNCGRKPRSSVSNGEIWHADALP